MMPAQNEQEMPEQDELPLLTTATKKSSRKDSPLEKEIRRYNKLVKELQEQEKLNYQQQMADDSYMQLFFKKVQPLLIELSHTQLAFVEQLESVFYANKFSKHQEQLYLSLCIPMLQDAAKYVDMAADKLNNYLNWQQTLPSHSSRLQVDVAGSIDANEAPDNFQPASAQQEEVLPAGRAIDAKKNIAELYKELAKMIHPDLEQDEQRRHLKAQLMQQLTAARENEDVHAMLLIRQEADAINGRAAEEKSHSLQVLKMYNSAMKKKLEQLRRKLQQQVYESFGSRKAFFAAGRKPMPVEKRVKADVQQIQALQQNLQHNLRLINTAADLKELLQQVDH